MKAKEIRMSDKVTLQEKMNELKKELVKMNAQIAMGTTIKNPGMVRKIKKTIARINTINHERGMKNKQEVAKKA
jgi:large subunit ribosomal protein L29